eukprot:Sro90_g047190.2  (366) ;mRNA; f:5351-6448
MGSGSANGGPTMRRPSRKKSGEYTATPTKRRPSRKKSNDAKGALRRNRSSISRQASNSSALSRMSRMLRRPPSRQNTSDGTSNAVLRRTQTTEATATQQPSSNGSLRRSRTSDERALPKRNFSARLPSRSKSSKSGHKRPSRTSSLKPPPPTSLNIFGSDIVSTDFILSQLDELEQNTDIVQVEMEDCLVTQRALAIPLRLKEVLQGEIRPWETIQFVDELLDGVSQYKDFKRSRKHFHKALGGVCAQKVIPVSYKVKVHVREEDNADDADMVDLLQQFQKDVTVTTLHVNTTKASLALIQSLTALLQCDERVWDGENMQWQVSCNEPQPAEVVAAGGLEQWQAAMKTAMKKLQKVAVAKEIVMS